MSKEKSAHNAMKRIILLPVVLCVLIGIARASIEMDDEFFTKPIRAKFDENTIIETTHAEAREIAARLGRKGVGYIDVTDITLSPTPQKSKNFPTKPSYKKIIDPLLLQLSESNLEAYDTHLASYPTRYYSSKDGVAAATWIKTQFETFSTGAKNVDVKFFEHSWAQPSVIATLKGYGPLADEVVVIGAHEDSINANGGSKAPGADDDGSGTSAILEVFRVLVASGIKFNRTIQFMTYAAEEVGLRGSADIANTYQNAGVDVYGVLQADMIGYSSDKPHIGIVTDYVNSDLTAFLEALIPTYTKVPYVTFKCGYACSDHASWYEAGFADVSCSEDFDSENPYIHTSKDTPDMMDFKLVLEYTKLILAFAAELALAN